MILPFFPFSMTLLNSQHGLANPPPENKWSFRTSVHRGRRYGDPSQTQLMSIYSCLYEIDHPPKNKSSHGAKLQWNKTVSSLSQLELICFLWSLGVDITPPNFRVPTYDRLFYWESQMLYICWPSNNLSASSVWANSARLISKYIRISHFHC